MLDRHLAALCRLQRLAPVVHSRSADQWVATGHDAVDGLLRSGSLVKKAAREQAAVRFTTPALREFHTNNVLFSDPPDHSRFRRSLRGLYPPGGVAALRPIVEAEARRILDALPRGRRLDLFAAFAYPLPVAVICRLLGVDEGDTAGFLGWSRAITRIGEVACSDEQIAAAEAAMVAMGERVGRSIDDPPGDPDCYLALLGADVRAGTLRRDEAVALAIVSFMAGHETTAGLLGSALAHIGQDPDLQDGLHDHRDQIPAAVQELLRLYSPIQFFQYSAACPVAAGTTEVPEDGVVFVSYAAANRDPDAFSDPHDFRLDREPGHLAFGLGRHGCPGGPLATIEGEVALDVVLSSLRVEIADGDVVWSDLRFIHRPEEIWATVHDRVPPVAGHSHVVPGAPETGAADVV